MFTFDVKRFIPAFLLNDKNGHALAKAIETGIQIMNDKIYQGVQCLTDIDNMPEWRLDELAWEYNLIYDYDADLEVKRNWIRDMRQYYALYGTAAGIIKYLEAVYESVIVEEWPSYNGDPFHFRVIVSGEWTEEHDAWAQNAIAQVKNVRSVLDNIIFNGGESRLSMLAGAAVSGLEITVTSKTL